MAGGVTNPAGKRRGSGRIARLLAVAGLLTATLAFSWFLAAQVGVATPLHPGGWRYSPEAFFTGAQLELARAIRDGDLARTRKMLPKADLSLMGKKQMTMLAFTVQETVTVN